MAQGKAAKRKADAADQANAVNVKAVAGLTMAVKRVP
jgi:hypothetical protein